MILSMTGYGTGSAQKDDITVSVEIRTVNHRFLDLHVRTPREYVFLEGEIQQMVRGALDRGRVDVNTSIQCADSTMFLINKNMIRSYVEASDKLKKELDLKDSLDLKTLLSLPGVLQNQDSNPADSNTIVELTKTSVRAAIEGVIHMRKREGEALRTDMLQNLANIEKNTVRIQELSRNSSTECMQKLRDRIEQLLPQIGIDPQRIAQEAALLADKCDISEEVARLSSHLEQYHKLMDSKEKAGKKLDFLLQELQREANTILSKSGNLDISHNAIEIKTDIEKLREQVQNVE